MYPQEGKPTPDPQQLKIAQLRAKKKQTLQARRELLNKLPNPGTSADEHPKLVAKFNGYMALLQKKLEKDNITCLEDYYSSSYFTDLKEKRNISFSQDILQKMYKQYSLEQFSSNISKGIFDPTAPAHQEEYYEALNRRAGDRRR